MQHHKGFDVRTPKRMPYQAGQHVNNLVVTGMCVLEALSNQDEKTLADECARYVRQTYKLSEYNLGIMWHTRSKNTVEPIVSVFYLSE